MTTRKKRSELLFIALTLLATLLLWFIPTGFEGELESDRRAVVKGRVLAVDNSSIMQRNIVKTGAQGVTVEILNSSYKGEVVQGVNTLIGKMELDKFFREGDRVHVVCDLKEGEIIYANILDHYRLGIEFYLFAAFIIVLLLFAGFTGLKALLSFVFTILVIWKILLPGFLKNYSPLFLSLCVVFILTFVIIFLVGGVNRKGLVAFGGSILGILLTSILSLIFGALFKIHGAVKPFSETLLYAGFPHLNLSEIFLSGIFISSSGAVMDVAMDISASVHEVVVKKPEISMKEAIISGFTVGKSVIGTMTTTLLLAYTGGYTTMLMVFIAQKTPALNILTLSYVASEILNTLVGSFGLVTVAPITAIMGGLCFVKLKNRPKVLEK